MTRAIYDALAAMAGIWLASSLPVRYPVDGRMPRASSAVYVVLDADCRLRYVGSVARADPDALRRRIREHGNRDGWRWAVVIPLAPNTPVREVRRIEGAVGRAVFPSDNRRLPTAA
jgi:hypothetical protein